MNSIILFSVITLGSTAIFFAVLLFYIAKKFHVKEDPRVEEVTNLLPGVNCGACGYPGCSGLATALVQSADDGGIGSLFCPPGGSETMSAIGSFLGVEAAEQAPTVAVLRCGGSYENSPPKLNYDGPAVCTVAHSLFTGPGGCPHGCLGCGDCEKACTFDAITMDTKTGLPVVDQEKCTSCGACVTACPRNLFEIRPVGRKNRRVWINCQNQEKGAAARKNCKTACIGCGKCVKVCDAIVQAITMENNLAYINSEKCIACGKCISECPTSAIQATFTPPQAKKKDETPEPVKA